jgi:hypothetical protein
MLLRVIEMLQEILPSMLQRRDTLESLYSVIEIPPLEEEIVLADEDIMSESSESLSWTKKRRSRILEVPEALRKEKESIWISNLEYVRIPRKGKVPPMSLPQFRISSCSL